MRCLSPRTVGFYADGKTICWSQKHYSKEFATFQLPCGKCLECRLEYARQWAIRCVHEAQMHEENCFITLTYSEENLKSDKLIYSDFQKFMKRLRFAYPNRQIGCFVTGEYGEQRKRPHWHAILFGFSPPDSKFLRQTPSGDSAFTSESLTKIWGHGFAEFGSVTFDSAGYCARYSLKKLVHGRDGSHDYDPISKKSSKFAIGKRWIEKFWRDVFNQGEITLLLPHKSPQKTCIPRYYEKWFAKNHPLEWEHYVTRTKQKKMEAANARTTKEKLSRDAINVKRAEKFKTHQISQSKVRKIILEQKTKFLGKNGDT